MRITDHGLRITYPAIMVTQEGEDGKLDYADRAGDSCGLWDGARLLYGWQIAAASNHMKHARLSGHLAEVVAGG